MRTMKSRVAAIAAAVAIAATPAAAILMSASPAAAAGTCSAGVWGGVNGWGDCRNMGSQKWQLKVSCTWGQSKTSSVITGDGHVDVTCPLNTTARTASIIFL